MPADLAKPSRAYRTRVVIVLVCLLVFVGTYLALAVGSAVACYDCVHELTADEPPAPPPPRTQYVTKNGRAYAYTPPQPSREKKPVFPLVLGAATSGLPRGGAGDCWARSAR